MKWIMPRKRGTTKRFPSRKGSHKRVHGHLVAMFALAAFFLAILNVAVILSPSRVAQATPSAPTYLGAGAGTDGTGTLNVAYPSGVAVNDLLIMQVTARNDVASSANTPAGWTLLAGPDVTLGSTMRQWIFSKIATGSETGTQSVTFTSGTHRKLARMYLFRGTVTSSYSEGSALNRGSTALVSPPNVAATAEGRLAVAFVAADDDDSISSFTGESGSDWTEATGEYLDSGLAGMLQLQTANLQSGGAVSGGSNNMSGDDDWSVRAFALIGIDTTPSSDNISGWAWSDTGGWLSLNSSNAGAGGGTYGVDMNESTKVITGFAWSDNQGWVCFGSSCASASCANGANTPAGSAPTASIDASNRLRGWAMVCNLGAPDGWISLNCLDTGGAGSCATSSYGAVVNFGTGDFGGSSPYAWNALTGSNGWGWIDLDDVYLTSGFEGTTLTCNDGLDNDADGGTDCGNAPPADDMCYQQTAFNCPAQETQCGLLGRANCCSNSVDDDDDDLIDCDDPNCSADPMCVVEICDNSVDDDGDTDVDCDDDDCDGFPACTPAWIRANYGNIYSQQQVGGNAPPPGQTNATYCISSAGSISNFTSASGCTEPSSVPLSLPSGGNGYVSNIGRLDVAGVLAGRYGTVKSITSEDGLEDPLNGKVYVYDRDANGNTCPSAGPNGANTAFTLSDSTAFFSNASGSLGRGNGLLIVKGCDVVIQHSLSYTAGNVSYLRNLASFGLVALAKYSGGVPVSGGNVYIDPGVDDVVGLIFAERSLHTGSTGNTFTDIKLTVYGALVSRDIKLERRYGSPTDPAEEVIFDGRGVVNPPPGLQDITKSLPSAVGDTF